MSQMSRLPAAATPNDRATRDLFIRGVPSETWDRIHVHAIHSRLRLKDYLIKVLEMAQPFPPSSPGPN